MNRKYSGFTLVEMLIVMGIIIILMAVGIAAGRFAIQRANDTEHQNGADQFFIAAQSYLTDEREYPELTEFAGSLEGTVEPDLSDYLSLGEFRGGTDTTYYYWTNNAKDAAVVCVALGGIADEDSRGYYCTGNAFGDPEAPTWLSSKEINPIGGDAPAWVADWYTTGGFGQNWNNETDSFDVI